MLYLNRLCRKPITTANYGAVYSKQLRKYLIPKEMPMLSFFLVLDGHQLFQLLHHFSENKNSIYTAYSSLGNKWHMLCLYKASGQRKQVKDFWWGQKNEKQKWNIKVQYISIVIIFERHTPVQVFWEGKKQDNLKQWGTEPSRQHQPPNWVSELMNVSAFTLSKSGTSPVKKSSTPSNRPPLKEEETNDSFWGPLILCDPSNRKSDFEHLVLVHANPSGRSQISGGGWGEAGQGKSISFGCICVHGLCISLSLWQGCVGVLFRGSY